MYSRKVAQCHPHCVQYAGTKGKGKVIHTVKVNNIFGDEYSGAVGQSGVFAKWKGIQYRRKWVRPTNPKTSKQTSVRSDFKNAVSDWHALNSLQKKAYGYLAAGKGESGFNLLVQRWQMNKDTTRTVLPSYGMKVVGSALTLQAAEPVGAVAEKVLTLGTGKIISIDDAVPTATQGGAVQDDAVATGAKAFVDLEMGQVRIVSAPANHYWISYKYGGNQIDWEDIGTGTATKNLKHFPVDYGSVVLQDSAAKPVDKVTGAVQAAEVDIINGKLRSTSGNFAATSTVKYTTVTYLADVKVEVQKANSSFVAFRGYTDSMGRMKLGLTAQDENYDTNVTKTGFAAISRANQAASAAAKNESIVLSAA